MYFSNVNTLIEYISSHKPQPHEELIIFVGEASASETPQLINELTYLNVSFMGAIFPRLLIKEHAYTEGFLLKQYPILYKSVVLPYLMSFILAPETYKDCTALILADGLSSEYQTLINTVYNKLGPNVNYIGGGSGYYDMVHRPCLFTEKGFLQDALLICLIPMSCQHTVSHGWNILEGPYHITESTNNVLSTLDHYNAFEVYSDAIEAHEGIRLYQSDFFLHAVDHPFGIIPPQTNELIVRDPISVNEQGDITCIADIPKDSSLYILHGDMDSLLLSSLNIATQCSLNLSTDTYEPLLFDCISRAMFMDDQFTRELYNIQSNLDCPITGCLCIGEITSQSNGEPIIHNKSTVLCLLQQA